MSGESRDLPHAAGAFDLFLGGLPQQTVASVDHRETPQQFDKMATADLYRDLLSCHSYLSETHWKSGGQVAEAAPAPVHHPHARLLCIQTFQNPMTDHLSICASPRGTMLS